jgi:hypothetical protein
MGRRDTAYAEIPSTVENLKTAAAKALRSVK